MNSSAGTELPKSGIISSISDKLILSIKYSQLQMELPYLYIPDNLSSAAFSKLQEFAFNKEFIFSYTDKKLNRHGAFNAVIKSKADGKSLQELLLENGLAIVYFVGSSINNAALFTAEEKARKARVGIWQDGKFIIHHSAEIEVTYNEYLNHFIIIEAKVDNIYTSKKNTYLNFGKDWKTDFTLQLDNKTLKNFPEFTPDKLKGKNLRVRGWLENYNGPFMKIFNLANIQIIPEK